MATEYGGENFGDDEREVLSRGYDEQSGSEIAVIACPPEAIDGDGPVFESIDGKTVYVLMSERFIQATMDAAPDERSATIQYGMMLGDVMRRGVFYAQKMQENKKRRNNDD